MANQADLEKLRNFLDAAAEGKIDKKHYGKKGKTGDPVIDALDEVEDFAKAAEHAGLGQVGPWLPSEKLCKALLHWWNQEYGHAPAASPPFDQMYVVVRFAMPLVATAESEGGAAG